mmetsp:Transcript_41570/g.50578  ORF Transcript_41570/g.50578 Transcript_41570/m.50578 type:complete len:92 (+) Transcript_41570:1973-2248(+)
MEYFETPLVMNLLPLCQSTVRKRSSHQLQLSAHVEYTDISLLSNTKLDIGWSDIQTGFELRQPKQVILLALMKEMPNLLLDYCYLQNVVCG